MNGQTANNESAALLRSVIYHEFDSEPVEMVCPVVFASSGTRCPCRQKRRRFPVACRVASGLWQVSSLSLDTISGGLLLSHNCRFLISLDGFEAKGLNFSSLRRPLGSNRSLKVFPETVSVNTSVVPVNTLTVSVNTFLVSLNTLIVSANTFVAAVNTGTVPVNTKSVPVNTSVVPVNTLTASVNTLTASVNTLIVSVNTFLI
jgi:hypothetical protein